MDANKKVNVTLAAIFGPMRPSFLLLPPVCVALGVGTALWSGAHFDLWLLLLTLVGAVCAHIAVNALNEYSDFVTGLDAMTERTPFSGGSGVLPQNPDKAHYALITGLAAAAVTALIGCYLVWLRGMGLLPVGVIGLLVILAYTPWLGRSWFLCLIAPGLGFGTMMVLGRHYVFAGSFSWAAVAASMVPFFLVSDLLLLNQFPDVEPDQKVGRRHLLIVFGRDVGARVYVLFLAGAYAAITLAYFMRVFPGWALLGLLTLAVAAPTARGVLRFAGQTDRLIPFLAKNVLINLATPALVAVGLIVAAVTGAGLSH
jgi:1,4-dihydroxy-2-naphthoate polyprenyltransferase